ncbi:hypothetical protein [Nocardia sp. NPDC057440]|uniref:hypothetical protein n=1 Tax=Nocardia sp. NPDC057440 TaxID=3346134 RepID=UPI0036713810
MSERPQNWLSMPSVSRDQHSVALHRTPIVGYGFGRSGGIESSADTNDPTARNRAWVDDPRVIHGRVSPHPAVDADGSGEQDGRNAAPSAHQHRAADSLVSSPGGNGHGHERVPAVTPWSPQPVVVAEITPVDDIEAMPEAQAIANVRRYMLSRNSDPSKCAPGTLVAERLSVGWIVRAAAIGRQRDGERIYCIADDGELEETSSSAEPSAYIKSFEQRFRQRRAMFG